MANIRLKKRATAITSRHSGNVLKMARRTSQWAKHAQRTQRIDEADVRVARVDYHKYNGKYGDDDHQRVQLVPVRAQVAVLWAV
eukprot:scaffold187676_cov26-Tisochrysis_lutea.AAC.6